jgi:predicted alpha/beta superfamily hydrolase
VTAPVTLHHTEDHLLRSEHVEEEFHLWIARPMEGFAGPASQPPVALWVLDGDLFFGTAVEMTRLMHRLYGELPPILVVGVAYGTDDPQAQGELRNRDFTPTADAEFLEMGRRMNPSWEPLLPEGRRMGRARPFLRFLVEEARPYVEARFDVAPGSTTLFGSSLGGLFAVWSKLAEPGAFDRTIAVSPALWWDGGAVMILEERVAGSSDDLPGKLFLAVGGLEEPEHQPVLARFRLVSNVRTLAERLESRGYPSLEVTAQVLEGETHTSVVPVGLTRGLRAFFGGPPPRPEEGGGA